MITVPTGEVLGILGDTIPFAGVDKDFTLFNCVRLWWDGDQLHAEATDRFQWGHAWWHPQDAPPEDTQDDLFTDWGGADNPWELFLDLADAKDIVKNFKLGAKQWGVPLTIDCAERRLRIERQRTGEHSALRQDIDGWSWDTSSLYPSVEKMLAEHDDKYLAGPTENIAFNAVRLGAYAKVRQRGPVEMSFTGPEKTAKVVIGKRFVGAIMPIRMGKDGEQ